MFLVRSLFTDHQNVQEITLFSIFFYPGDNSKERKWWCCENGTFLLRSLLSFYRSPALMNPTNLHTARTLDLKWCNSFLTYFGYYSLLGFIIERLHGVWPLNLEDLKVDRVKFIWLDWYHIFFQASSSLYLPW